MTAATRARSRAARRSQPEPWTESLRRWWPWISFGLVLAVLCGGWYFLPLKQWLDGLRAWLGGFGAWGFVLFAVLVAVVTFLPAPDWPLPIAAGYIYGVWGFPLMFAATAAAATVVFLIARYVARDRVKALLQRRAKYLAIDKAIASDGWQIVLLVRLSPFVPFNLQNYAFGVSAIPTWQYVAATLVGIMPGTALYVYFGIFGKGLNGGPSALDWTFLGFGIVATIALGLLVTRKTKEKLGA